MNRLMGGQISLKQYQDKYTIGETILKPLVFKFRDDLYDLYDLYDRKTENNVKNENQKTDKNSQNLSYTSDTSDSNIDPNKNYIDPNKNEVETDNKVENDIEKNISGNKVKSIEEYTDLAILWTFPTEFCICGHSKQVHTGKKATDEDSLTSICVYDNGHFVCQCEGFRRPESTVKLKLRATNGDENEVTKI